MRLDSICVIPFQPRASEVKLPKSRLHSSSHGMAFLVNVFGTFQCKCDPADDIPGALGRFPADMFSNINNRNS
jgi:hypothetical protein